MMMMNEKMEENEKGNQAERKKVGMREIEVITSLSPVLLCEDGIQDRNQHCANSSVELIN